MVKSNEKLKKITIRMKKSLIGCTKSQRQTMLGLGLRHCKDVSTLENTSSVRGMIKKSIHLLEIVSETK